MCKQECYNFNGACWYKEVKDGREEDRDDLRVERTNITGSLFIRWRSM